MYAQHLPESTDLYRKAYFWINQCVIIQPAMTMFTLIAGYLFNYLYAQGKYQDYWKMVKKKAVRLLVPFFVFSMLMMATTGVQLIPWKLYTGVYSHLWFITTLFWCFVISGLVQRHVKKGIGKLVLFCVFSCVCVIFSTFDISLPPFMGLHNIPRWYCWFLLGQILADYRERLVWSPSKTICACLCLIPHPVQAFLWPVSYADMPWYQYLTITAFVIGVFYLFSNISEKGMHFCAPLIWLSKYSFGIYIFHNWIGPYLISRTAKRIFPLQAWAIDHVILFPMMLTLAILAISWGLSWGLLKTKVGKTLVG